MSAEWYCKIAGREFGPLSAPELRSMVAEGSLTPTHMVRQGAEGTWVKAAAVKGLFGDRDRPAAWEGTPQASAVEPILRAKPAPQSQATTPVGQARATRDAPSAHAPRPLPAQPTTNIPELLIEAAGPTHAINARGVGLSGSGSFRLRRQNLDRKLLAVALISLGVLLIVAPIAYFRPGFSSPLEASLRNADKAKKSAKLNPEESEVAPGGAKTETATEPKPADAAAPTPDKNTVNTVEVSWVDAVTKAIRRGDAQVHLSQVIRSKPTWINEQTGSKLGHSKDPVLVVKLELAKVGSSPFDYKPWGRRYTDVTLKDDLGRRYAPTQRPNSVPEGQISEPSVKIDESASDILVFSLPKERYKYLRLQLPGAAIGQEEPLGFEIPASWVKDDDAASEPAGATQSPKEPVDAPAKPKVEGDPGPTGDPAVDLGIEGSEKPGRPQFNE